MGFSRYTRVALVLASLILAMSAATAFAGHGNFAGRSSLQAILTGENERPGPGDPDGRGSFGMSIGSGVICYNLKVTGIATPTAAHIHVADINHPGPVVIPLKPPVNGEVRSCDRVSGDQGRAILNAIKHQPSHYYVNVHNAEYPAGALRGQLR